MFFEIGRIIEVKRPQASLLENVKQLKGRDEGRILSVILEHFKKLNYHVEYKVLRVGGFGVPQIREKIYIVGLDKDVFTLPEDYVFPFPIPTGKTTRVGDVLEKDVNKKYTISDRLWEGQQ